MLNLALVHDQFRDPYANLRHSVSEDRCPDDGANRTVDLSSSRSCRLLEPFNKPVAFVRPATDAPQGSSLWQGGTTADRRM